MLVTRLTKSLALRVIIPLALLGLTTASNGQCYYGDINQDGFVDAADLGLYDSWLLGPDVYLQDEAPADMPRRRTPTLNGSVYVGGDGRVSMADVLAFQASQPITPDTALTRKPPKCDLPNKTYHVGWEVGDTTPSFRKMKALVFVQDNLQGTFCIGNAPTLIASWGGMYCEFAPGNADQPDPIPPQIEGDDPYREGYSVQAGTIMGTRGAVVFLQPVPPWAYYLESVAFYKTDNAAVQDAGHTISFGLPPPALGFGEFSSFSLYRTNPPTGTPADCGVEVRDSSGVQIWHAEQLTLRLHLSQSVLRWNHAAFNTETKNFGDEVPGIISVCSPLQAMSWRNFYVQHEDNVIEELRPRTYGNIQAARNPDPTRWMTSATDSFGRNVFLGHYPHP